MKNFEMKTSTITSKGQISIPKEMREKGGFTVGSKVAIVSFDNRVEIRPLAQVQDKLYGALISEKSLAKDWLSKEDDGAWKDL